MIGVDIGTTSTKAVLYTVEGEMMYQAHIEYPLHTPTVDISEEDPDEIVQAVKNTIKQVIVAKGIQANEIKFVALSAQMHSLIIMDDDHHRLTNSITWADNRAQIVAERLKANNIQLYEKTGTPIHAMSPLSKILWFKEHQTNIFHRASCFVDIKSYVLFQLTGRWVIDVSLASATGMMNLKTRQWDQEILNLLNINSNQLPEIVPTTEQLWFKNQEIAQDLGLSQNTPIIVGASDGVLSNLGVNRFRKGEIALTIGTSGAIRTVVDEPIIDEAGRTFCYVLDESHYVVGGPVNNGAVVLRWLKEELLASETETAKRLNKDSYALITEIAETVEPGANGLLFHPYLTGERAPLWTSDARGSFIGLTLAHQKEHMIRAVLEGVILNLYSVFRALNEVIDAQAFQISATGGFAKSALWRQIVADIFDAQVDVPVEQESSCLGACVVGLKSIGEIDDYEILNDWTETTYIHEPNKDNHQIYQQLVPIFDDIAQSLTHTYRELAQFQRSKNH
nr:gluconokinase [Staphylococcus canis]